MASKKSNKTLAVIVTILIVLSGFNVALLWLHMNEKAELVTAASEKDDILSQLGIKTMSIELSFSEPSVKEFEDYSCVYVNESDVYAVNIGRPVLPVNISVVEFAFGTEIIDFSYDYSTPENIEINKRISFGSYVLDVTPKNDIYVSNQLYPSEYVTYTTGGGLSNGEHKTFLVIRTCPVGYIPGKDQLKFVQNFKINIKYKEPTKDILSENSAYDLLIIAPSKFTKQLQPLVNHKNEIGIRTNLVTLDEVYDKGWMGRDNPEKIKYFIKTAIENWGIKYVILVGGMKPISKEWYLPIRYSHVLIPKGTQEIIEPEFISDLYYADIYDSKGDFSSWDSNNNGIFAEWDGGTTKDNIDLYPDVYLGRLACRNKFELKTVVNKIINYENNRADESWFNKVILVSGDHWKDPDHINEGVLMMDQAEKTMSGFTAVKLMATEESMISVRDINKALNSGAGFAYFCGHGGSTAWGIHYPPDAEGWAPTLFGSKVPFYYTIYMNFLRNKNKLPITIVGGCLNAKFDIPGSCWAWKLTSKRGGGSIATIANTGLGTHAMGDSDGNSVNDYLEVLDGWMELRFLELFAQEHKDILGENQGQTITEYLHRFLGNYDEMDTKMVQQWQLFGDPSLKIGGY